MIHIKYLQCQTAVDDINIMNYLLQGQMYTIVDVCEGINPKNLDLGKFLPHYLSLSGKPTGSLLVA